MPLYHFVNNFIIINHENFPTDSSMNKINTRNKQFLHKTYGKRTCIQKSTFYTSIKIFSNLPTNAKILKNVKAKFKVALVYILHLTLLLVCG